MIAGRARPRLGLTLRITLAFTLGALLVSSAVALSAYLFTLRFQVQQQERITLRQTYLNAAQARARLIQPDPDVPGVLDTLTTGSAATTVIYRGGRWYASSLTISRDALPLQMRQQVIAGSVVRSWSRIDRAPKIIVGVPLPAANAAYFQVFDESSLQQTLSLLRTILVAAASTTTAAGAALGWWLSRRLTAPLRAVDDAARRIAAGNLQAELPAESDRDVANLVDSFNTMVRTLRARIERDTRFAADVSHELRSPLTTLATSLGVLQARRDEMPDRARDALDLLTTELARFERLVEDLLEISRADTQARLVDPEPVNVGQLVENLLQTSEYAGIPSRVEGDCDQAVVLGDKRRLHQALRNLLDNAATYAGGATAVIVTTGREAVTIHVDDAGPGVPQAERERIFDRFSRGRQGSRRASQRGTGLGLALVTEHVRAHGGSVHVEDAPSGGARFTVQLPRRRR